MIIGVLVVGIILGTSIGVGAATYFSATEVSYTPSDETWDVSNVKEAIDNLYNISSNGSASYLGYNYSYTSKNHESFNYTFDEIPAGEHLIFVKASGYVFQDNSSNFVIDIDGITFNHLGELSEGEIYYKTSDPYNICAIFKIKTSQSSVIKFSGYSLAVGYDTIFYVF